MKRRRSLRLSSFDYAEGAAYFVTICSAGRKCIFSDIVDGDVRLTNASHLLSAVWYSLPDHYASITLDEMTIMPNHFHCIFFLNVDVYDGQKTQASPAKRHSLFHIVSALKSYSAQRINRAANTTGSPVWQRGYYEHVIRNEAELYRVREYIRSNCLQWELDMNNPEVLLLGNPTSNCQVSVKMANYQTECWMV